MRLVAFGAMFVFRPLMRCVLDLFRLVALRADVVYFVCLCVVRVCIVLLCFGVCGVDFIFFVSCCFRCCFACVVDGRFPLVSVVCVTFVVLLVVLVL